MNADIEFSSKKHAHELAYNDSIDIREKDWFVFCSFIMIMNQINHEMKPLKVLEKFQLETKTFNNKHEFQEYLNKHIVSIL